MIHENIRSLIPTFAFNFLKRKYDNYQYKVWKNNGCPIPPPHIVKQLAIKEYQSISGYTCLIETGTYKGAMVEAQKSSFKSIFSIELSAELYEKAKTKFKKDKNVTIVQGDSSKELPKVLRSINEPAIFWLDGHYSAGITAKGEKECPIYEELDAIFKNSKFNHILLIDDARFFNGNHDYPTIIEFSEYVHKLNNKYSIEVKNDIIRLFIYNSSLNLNIIT
jgi:hypothetical protein